MLTIDAGASTLIMIDFQAKLMRASMTPHPRSPTRAVWSTLRPSSVCLRFSPSRTRRALR